MGSSWVMNPPAPQRAVPPLVHPEAAEAAGQRPSARSSPASIPSIVWAFGGERPPTMPAADFCRPINRDRSQFSGSLHTRQTSRGKTRNVHGVDAGFIKHRPVADGGLDGHVPTGPTDVTPHIQFLFVAPRIWIGLPSDPAWRRCPCPSPSLRLHEYLARGLSPR